MLTPIFIWIQPDQYSTTRTRATWPIDLVPARHMLRSHCILVSFRPGTISADQIGFPALWAEPAIGSISDQGYRLTLIKDLDARLFPLLLSYPYGCFHYLIRYLISFLPCTNARTRSLYQPAHFATSSHSPHTVSTHPLVVCTTSRLYSLSFTPPLVCIPSRFIFASHLSLYSAS